MKLYEIGQEGHIAHVEKKSSIYKSMSIHYNLISLISIMGT